MKRTIIALVSTLLLAACEAPTDQEVVASSPTVASDIKFSWEKSSSGNSTATPSVNLEAPKDTTKARVLEIREGSGLIALAMAEKPAVHAHLQIIKDNKVLLVDVASTNEAQVVVNVIPNQLKRPELIIGDEVICTPAAVPAAQ
jgi:hypothetical protein